MSDPTQPIENQDFVIPVGSDRRELANIIRQYARDRVIARDRMMSHARMSRAVEGDERESSWIAEANEIHDDLKRARALFMYMFPSEPFGID